MTTAQIAAAVVLNVAFVAMCWMMLAAVESMSKKFNKES